MLRKLLLISFIGFLTSCGKDNGLDGPITVRPASLDSIRAVNEEELVGFLQSHTYKENQIAPATDGDL